MTRTMARLGPAIWTTALLALVASMTVTTWRGVPEPAYHDEASYLLAADTFLHGRLANPSLPIWQPFETFHVLQQPTYASKYPPAQGIMLALGSWIVGHPIAGSWLGGAAMAAAFCWMFAAFLPVRWAFLGAVLATAQAGPASYWVQGYWGGCLPAVGGALLFGAVPRLKRRGRTRDAVWLALGLVILANSRPFEGLLAGLLAAGFLLPWFLRRDGGLAGRSARVALPVALILLAAGVLMAIYNKAVTGDHGTMPYSVYEKTASGLPLFIWQEAKAPPEFRHEMQRRFYEEYLLRRYERQQSLAGWVAHRRERLAVAWTFYFGPFLSLLWLALPWTWRRPGGRMALLGLALFLLGSAVTSPLHAHYAAPFAPLVFLLLTMNLRWFAVVLSRWRGWRWWLLPAVLLIGTAGDRLLRDDPVLRIGKARGATTAKVEIRRFLDNEDGDDLVLMRYGPAADIHDDWVANGAEPWEQSVIWARSMGDERDQLLAEALAPRHVWRVTVGRSKRGEVELEKFP